MESKNILVTTDFSEVSFAALAYAAKMQGNQVNLLNQVTLLNVVQTGEVPPDLLKQMPNPNAVQEYREGVLKQVKDELESIAKKYFSEKNVRTEVIIGTDNPAEDICTYADENAIDIIVMTGQGRNILSNLFIGSTVQKILRITKHPVLIVPHNL